MAGSSFGYCTLAGFASTFLVTSPVVFSADLVTAGLDTALTGLVAVAGLDAALAGLVAVAGSTSA